MNDQKHFHYEGQIEIKSKPKDIEIVDLSFLTPARITAKIDGRIVEMIVGVDLINKKVYENNKECILSEKVFEYLDEINSLPEDFFGASEDVRNTAEEAQQDHDTTRERVSNV